MSDYHIPGHLIISTRKAQGLTQAQLAEKLGIDVSTLCRIEKELVKPDVEKLDKLAKWLNVTITLGKGDYELNTIQSEILSQKLIRIKAILEE